MQQQVSATGEMGGLQDMALRLPAVTCLGQHIQGKWRGTEQAMTALIIITNVGRRDNGGEGGGETGCHV